MQAIHSFEAIEGSFDRLKIQQQATRFTEAHFASETRRVLEREWLRKQAAAGS